MKRCPTCHRTYADDAFTFCLEDGTLLSAPYDPEKKQEPISTIQSSGPPPTAVLPSAPTSSEQAETKPTPLPTVASPVREQFEQSSPRARKRRLLPLIAIPAALLILVVMALAFYSLKKASCPKVDVVCSTSTNGAFCFLNRVEANNTMTRGPAICSLNLQESVPMSTPLGGFTQQTWSTSLGKTRPDNLGLGTRIDTTGFAGRQITVTVTFGPVDWPCPHTASASFVAQ